VETILVGIDQIIPGRIDDQGAVSFAGDQARSNMAWSTKSPCVSSPQEVGSCVRKPEIPREQPLSAVLRYAA